MSEKDINPMTSIKLQRKYTKIGLTGHKFPFPFIDVSDVNCTKMSAGITINDTKTVWV
jgi:hypothetical protein